MLSVRSRRLTFPFCTQSPSSMRSHSKGQSCSSKNKTEFDPLFTRTSYIGTSYLLASTVFLPLFASIADIYGRHFGLQLSLLFFLVGSALSTGAVNMPMILAGRGIAGIGAAGLLTVCPFPCRALTVFLTSALGRLARSFLFRRFGVHRSFEPSCPTRDRSTRTISNNQHCFYSMRSVSVSVP